MNACDKDKSEPVVEEPTCDSIPTVSYANHIQPLLNNNCNTSSCHGGGAGNVSFSDYATVKSYVDNGQLEQRVLIDQNMPPTEPLIECDQKLLQQWLDAGAPNN